MAHANTKYSLEMKEKTARHIIESGKAATKVAEELGIAKAMVCKWVSDYRVKHGLPTWHEERGLRSMRPQKSDTELLYEKKELEKELKRAKRELADKEETIEILKKSLAIFTQPTS